MTKETVILELKQRYITMYLDYCELKKKKIRPLSNERKKEYGTEQENYFMWKIGWNIGENDNSPECERRKFIIETIMELANEGMPEAYMEARRHSVFRNEYPGICAEINRGLFPPYGGICNYERDIAEKVAEYRKMHQKDSNRYEKGFEKQILEAANENARGEWRRNREGIFCGMTGVYDENETWRHIESNIIPFATLDIWESLYEFYNGKDSCVPSEDRKNFNVLYEDYMHRNPEYENLKYGNKKEPKNQEKKTDIDIINEYKNCDDKIVFEKALNSKKRNVSFKDLAAAYYARKFLDLSDEAVSATVKEKFEMADESICRRLMEGLRTVGEPVEANRIPEEWIIIRQFLLRFNKIPETWEHIIVEQFNSSMRNSPDLVGWWISFLYDNNLFYTYVGYDKDFWNKIAGRNIENLVSIIRKCIADNSVMYNLYHYVSEHCGELQNGEELLTILQRECIDYTYSLQSYSKALRTVSTSIDCFCRSAEDWKKYSKEIDYIIEEHIKNDNKHNIVENNLPDKILNSLEPILVTLKDMNSYLDGIDANNESNKQVIADLRQLMNKMNNSINYFKDYWTNKNF